MKTLPDFLLKYLYYVLSKPYFPKLFCKYSGDIIKDF